MPEELLDVGEQSSAVLVHQREAVWYSRRFHLVALQGEAAYEAEEALGEGLSGLASPDEYRGARHDESWIPASGALPLKKTLGPCFSET
ncbi:hypothetical protein [Streptomyces cadmiisoli]|uniref:hypothetical protein n=1 Tax=Streptomyces cadmiisoli TaxID=2184053 RepID=UPI003D71D298